MKNQSLFNDGSEADWLVQPCTPLNLIAAKDAVVSDELLAAGARLRDAPRAVEVQVGTCDLAVDTENFESALLSYYFQLVEPAL